MQNTKENNSYSQYIKSYDLNIIALLKESWSKIKGIKATYWGAFGIYLAITFVLQALLGSMSELPSHEIWAQICFGVLLLLTVLVQYSLLSGFILMGIRHMSGQAISIALTFYCFRVKKLLLQIVYFLLLMIAFDLLLAFLFFFILSQTHHFLHLSSNIHISISIFVAVILFFYLWACYIIAYPLVIERELNAWRSVIIAICLVSKRFLKILVIQIIALLPAILLTIVTLGIAGIWLLPFANNVNASLYREMVGVRTRPLAELVRTTGKN